MAVGAALEITADQGAKRVMRLTAPTWRFADHTGQAILARAPAAPRWLMFAAGAED